MRRRAARRTQSPRRQARCRRRRPATARQMSAARRLQGSICDCHAQIRRELRSMSRTCGRRRFGAVRTVPANRRMRPSVQASQRRCAGSGVGLLADTSSGSSSTGASIDSGGLSTAPRSLYDAIYNAMTTVLLVPERWADVLCHTGGAAAKLLCCENLLHLVSPTCAALISRVIRPKDSPVHDYICDA